MWTFQYKHGDRPLEGFTIQRAAGRGGFGEVYQAVSDSGREVALKVVLGYEQIELRGIGHCMNLKSPHLVSIFDVRHNDQGRPFVIMEYISGPSLRQLLDESPSGLGTQKAAFFLREMSKGLTYLHDCGIVHRDLKPGNIFYENGYVKIGDYGLSKAISTSQHSGQTVTVGTVHYMAPEIGAGKYDRSIDIYALGAVLFEMLTGTVPHVGATPTEVLLKHLSAEPDTTGIPEPFATVIKKAMAKDPANRFASVQEMVEAIFGAEHVRESVSVFRPEELSVAAEYVARKIPAAVAVGAGAGSGTAAPVGVGTPIGGYGVNGAAGSSAAVGGPGTRGDFWQRMGNLVDRVVYDDQQPHGPGAPPAAAPAPAAAPRRPGMPPPLPIQPAPADPLSTRQRRTLAVFVAVAVSLAAGVLSVDDNRGPVGPILFTLGMALAGAMTLVATCRWLLPRLAGMPAPLPRLITSLFVIVAAWIASVPGAAMSEKDGIPQTWPAIAICLLVMKLPGWTRPDRPSRVVGRRIVQLVILGVILASIFDGHIVLAIASLAGIYLVAQILSPWNPAAAVALADGPSGPARLLKWLSRPGAARPGQAIAPGMPHPAGPGIPRLPLGYAAAAAAVPAAPAGTPVPPWARLLWVAGLVVCVPVAVMLFVAAGTTRHESDVGPFCAIGVSTGLTAIFCLTQLFRHTFRGWWRYLLKPLFLLMCVQSIVSAAIIMGNARNLHDDDVIAGTFFITFPAVLFIVTLFVPARWLSRRASVADLPAAGAARAPDMGVLPGGTQAALDDRGPRLGPIAGTLCSAGQLLLLSAVLLQLAAALLPAMATAGVIHGNLANQLRQRQAEDVHWRMIAWQVGTLVAAVLWLLGATATAIGRRGVGAMHMVRGLLSSAFLALAVMPVNGQIEEIGLWREVEREGTRQALTKLLGLEFTLPTAGLLFVSMVLLAWPARRAGGSAR